MVNIAQKIYLDFNATTPLEPEVIANVTDTLQNGWANPSSSSDLGKRAKLVVDGSRTQIARMLNCSPSDVIFTSGGTEANNMVLWSALEYYNEWSQNKTETKKPHFVTTNVEHDAVKLPLKHYEAKEWADVSYVPVSSKNGQVITEEVMKVVSENTCLLSIMLANNETGVVMPVAEIGRAIKKLNIARVEQGLCKIFLHCDAAQAIGKIPVDVQELEVDYLTVVGHKFYGPRIGALFAKDVGGATPLYPMLFGGGQERSFRPGTENTPMISGLGCAAQLIVDNLHQYRTNMLKMRNLLEHLLHEEFGESVGINCHTADRLPNTTSVSFKSTSLTGAEILAKCPNLMASTAAACHKSNQLSAILLASGVSAKDARSTIRLSIGRHTTAEQIEQAVQMIKSALQNS